MESFSDMNPPKQVLWIGASRETIDRTSAITSSLFVVHSLIRPGELVFEELSSLAPGTPIILEFEDGEYSTEWIEKSNRIVQGILAYAKHPIILCIGHHVSAEAVVDWVRTGAYSYVERTADERHLQQAFQAMVWESAKIQEQYVRYEKLMLLWSSITEREASVLNMLMEGLPNKKIANCLGVSQRTIEARRQKLYEKLESRSIVDVVRTIYELDSLEHVFHRIDTAHQSSSVLPHNESKFLQTLPRLHSDVPKAHFRNLDEMKSELPSNNAE